jgi:hypothetical protein
MNKHQCNQYCHEPRKIIKEAIGWDVNMKADCHTECMWLGN